MTIAETQLESNTSSQSSQLRIVVISDAAPHRNGVGAYYHDLEQHLSEVVAEMAMIGPKIDKGKWKGGIALPLPGDNTQKFVIPNPIRLWRKLKKHKPDVVIIPTPGLFGTVGAMLARLYGAKVVVGFHTWYEKLTELYWSHWQGWLTKGFFEVSNKILFHFSNQVVVNSEFMATTAKQIGGENVEIVGTPVSYEFIKTPVTEPSGTVSTVLFAGRLAAEKNLEAIVEAAAALPGVKFDVAGDGPEREKFLRATRDLTNVRYLGWMNRNEMLEAIDQHDLLILPSHVESFGTIALEAMARKRLALVSSHCGIAHWTDLQAGLFHIGSDETLAQALQRIQQLPATRNQEVAAEARSAAVRLNQWNLEQWTHLLVKAVKS